MSRLTLKLLAPLLVAATCLGAWRHSHPPLDPTLLGAWGQPLEGEFVDFVLEDFTLAADGTFREPVFFMCGMGGWSPEPTKTWHIVGNELRLRTSYPVWPNEGSLKTRLEYASNRLSQTLQGRSSLFNIQVRRFRKETNAIGIISFIEVSSDPHTPGQPLRQIHFSPDSPTLSASIDQSPAQKSSE